MIKLEPECAQAGIALNLAHHAGGRASSREVGTASECFRDAVKKFTSKKAVVLGVSPDSLKAHDKFITKFGRPFLLLSDADHAIAENYGVWVEKSMYGRKYMGVERSTFVIGPDGKVKAAFRKVKVDGHVDEVLAAVAG